MRATHSGLALNPISLYVIADRLAQPEGKWQPFRPPDLLRPLFRTAPDYEVRS